MPKISFTTETGLTKGGPWQKKDSEKSQEH